MSCGGEGAGVAPAVLQTLARSSPIPSPADGQNEKYWSVDHRSGDQLSPPVHRPSQVNGAVPLVARASLVTRISESLVRLLIRRITAERADHRPAEGDRTYLSPVAQLDAQAIAHCHPCNVLPSNSGGHKDVGDGHMGDAEPDCRVPSERPDEESERGNHQRRTIASIREKACDPDRTHVEPCSRCRRQPCEQRPAHDVCRHHITSRGSSPWRRCRSRPM